VAWIQAQFEFLWNAARPLPEAVCREVRRRNRRYEIELLDIEAEDTLVQHPLNSSQESLTKPSIFATVGWVITASKGDNDGCSKV
jgi:hypothetical protein